MTENYYSASLGELAKALAAAQLELEPAVKNATNPMLKNRYADLASCFDAARRVLPTHGLAVSQIFMPADPGKICVRTMLIHTSGQWLASDCILPSEGNRGVNAAQAAGSAMTYARRYGLSSIIGLVADDDDDASYAGPTKKEKVEQARKEALENNPNPAPQSLKKAMFALLRERGFEDSEAMKAELSNFFSRQIESTNSLTVEEVNSYLDACKEAQNA